MIVLIAIVTIIEQFSIQKGKKTLHIYVKQSVLLPHIHTHAHARSHAANFGPCHGGTQLTQTKAEHKPFNIVFNFGRPQIKAQMKM